MKITLIDTSVSVVKAWKTFCSEIPDVEIKQGSIVEEKCCAVVSPANSFGFMDGGVDRVLLQHFGNSLQQEVHRFLQEHYFGEMLVGQADILSTSHSTIPFLVVAPTMRVPMKLQDSIHPYLAMRAILLLLRHGLFREGKFQGQPLYKHLKKVAIPGLGTGVGQVSPQTSAHQTHQAFLDFWSTLIVNPSRDTLTFSGP